MFKFLTNIIIYSIRRLIEIVEYFEYFNRDLDEDDIHKKVINVISSRIKVKSDTGFVNASEINLTQPFTHYLLTLDNGYELRAADHHLVFDINYSTIRVCDLNKGDQIWTDSGLVKVKSVNKLNFKSSMFDLSIDDSNQRYYTNGILSHNTVCSSITILHFVLFNNTKNVLVTANKLDTAVEILDKMREIYQMLPFFLQQGILNWNQKFMVFENKSRVKGFATTKTASIGQTADFLYLDEFAYLPDNIAEKFYKSVFPTVSNIDNSKIIITSTPNGINLFHRLLMDAEKPEGEKSNYIAKRVYWWQVSKRFITYVRLSKEKCSTYGIDPEEILEHYREKFPEVKSELYYNDELKKWVVNVFNSEKCSEDDVVRSEFRGVKIPEIAEITTWKKETIKDIGGEEAFNQEYDLRFINSSRSLLTEGLIDQLNKSKERYEWEPIDELDNRLKFSYLDLKWNQNVDIYNPMDRKNIKVVFSVDTAEGLGQDYSIINIFKLVPKPISLMENQKKNYKSIVDCFQLVQIGMYRCNLVSVQQLSEILYVLAFEYFNSENVKIVLEINAYGHELLAHLPNLFDGNNDYGSFIFFKYKHRSDAIEEKIGLKVGDNKNLLVKDYQDRMQSSSVLVNNNENINEITTFIKHTTSAGNVTYSADGSAHDDTVMTIVNMCSVFGKKEFKQICDEYLPFVKDSEVRNYINQLMNNGDYVEGLNYSQLLNIRRENLNHQKMMNSINRGKV